MLRRLRHLLLLITAIIFILILAAWTWIECWWFERRRKKRRIMVNVVTIHADGSCCPNPGKGGWGAILCCKNKRKEICGGQAEATNNQMELLACIKALEALKCPCAVEIYTDSTYVVQGMKTWTKEWERKRWKTSTGKPVKNKEYWMHLMELCRMHVVEWHWIKGHNGDRMQCRADELATMGRGR
jgi:ribonuclease HI